LTTEKSRICKIVWGLLGEGVALRAGLLVICY